MAKFRPELELKVVCYQRTAFPGQIMKFNSHLFVTLDKLN